MEQQRRKRGGQPKEPEERKRNNLTFRVRDRLKVDLEAAAAAGGRSVSEEIEHRLEQTLTERDMLTRFFGSEDVIVFSKMFAGMVQVAQALTNKSWKDDQGTRDVI